MDILINLKNNKILYENKEISIIFDNNENLWFNSKDISLILGYKCGKEGFQTNVDKEHKKCLSTIDTTHNIKKHNDSIYIDEEGLGYGLIKSRKTNCKKFTDWCFKFAIPLIKKIKYEQQQSIISNEFNNLKCNLNYLEKINNIFEYNIKNKIHTNDKSMLYISENIDDDIYYSIYIINNENDINKINSSMIYNKQKIIYKKEIYHSRYFELYIRQKLFNYILRIDNNIEIYKCDINCIIDIINECLKLFNTIVLNNTNNNICI